MVGFLTIFIRINEINLLFTFILRSFKINILTKCKF